MIKRNIKYIFIAMLLGVSLSLSSCEKWLNVSPKTQMKAEDMLSTESGFDDLLTGVYSLMTLYDSYGGKLSFTYLDVLAQYYSSPRSNVGTIDHEFKYSVVYDYTESNEERGIKNIWSTAYQGIANVNIGLRYIDENKAIFKKESSYNIYKGEFLALRAMLHFDMLRLFASAPAMDNGAGMNSLAIPYFKLYTNIAQPQLTVREVLDNAIADLVEAKTLMAPYDPYGPTENEGVLFSKAFGTRAYRMNYYAATALLARVYLYAGDKSNALNQAKEIVNEPTSDKPKEIFTMATTAATSASPMFSKENIFAINIPKLTKRLDSYVVELQNSSSLLVMSLESHSVFFENSGTSSDFRAVWLTPNTSQNGYLLGKFNNLSVEIPIITVSEVYLIAAECSSNADDGLKYLNKLRYFRGLNALTSSNDLNNEIYKEFQRDMIGCGQLFFFYKRNLYQKIGFNGNITLPGDLKSIYVLPIPKLEIEFGKIKN